MTGPAVAVLAGLSDRE